MSEGSSPEQEEPKIAAKQVDIPPAEEWAAKRVRRDLDEARMERLDSNREKLAPAAPSDGDLLEDLSFRLMWIFYIFAALNGFGGSFDGLYQLGMYGSIIRLVALGIKRLIPASPAK